MKELRIRMSKTHPMCYEVYYEGGGEVPQVLLGKYTTPTKAQTDIDIYLRKREETPSGRRSSKSRTD
jgi:hypothetical protein